VRRLVTNAAPTLQHFCVDATRVTDIVGILADQAPQLRELCLYGTSYAVQLIEVLARLPHLERLVAPSTNEFLASRRPRVYDPGQSSCLTRLALIPPRRYAPRYLATYRVDWSEIGAAVPLLTEFVLADT
jgi:hypothetical protein